MRMNELTLKEIIARHALRTVDARCIEDDTDLVNDLALDSIAIVQLFADLEEELHIEINAEDMSLPILGKYELFRDFVLNQVGERV